MEPGLFLPRLDQFMLSPLVTWVKTFTAADGDGDRDGQLDFSDLLDGVLLNDIMMQINPPASPQGANKVSRDPNQRIHNLSLLVQQIRTYYQDHLKQLIVIPSPNVLLLGRSPYCEQSLAELRKVLLLLLGCAVQCEKKEEYIERIQTLDFDTKAAIAVHIQELTHSQENILDLQWLDSSEMNPDELEALARNMVAHLRHLLEQRDSHLETIAELLQEKEGPISVANGPQPGSYPGHVQQQQQQQQVETQQHLVVELADSKAKIRRLRQELEEKSEQMLDCRHELENMEMELKRIQQENSQLLVEARAARTYRDELDALRERAVKADKLESEVGRYREQLHKIEFYKAKVEELKEDNRVLQETKEVLEDQLAGWRARSDKIHQLEKHGLLLKARIHDIEQEREVDQRRIEELMGENLALCLAQRRSMEESQLLGWELEQLSKTTETSPGLQTLSEEVSQSTHSRMLWLEKENKHLLRTVEELQSGALKSSTQLKYCQQLERDKVVCSSSSSSSSTSCKQRMFQRCLQLDEDASSHQQLHRGEFKEALSLFRPGPDLQEEGQPEDTQRGDHFKDLMSELDDFERDPNKLCCLVESRESAGIASRDLTLQSAHPSYAIKQTQRLEAKCRALDTVNQHLQTALDNSERKIQRLEMEVQELEGENQSLQATLEELRLSTRRLEQLEAEKQSLEQEITALERDKRQLEKENRRLRQQIEIQEANLESSNVCMAGLEREMRFLVKEVEALRETAERVKGLEADNRELSKQAAIDQRTLATLREELVNEKLKMQQRDNELNRLVHELEMKVLNQESVRTEQEAQDSRFKMLESELELSLKKSLRMKEDKMAALEAHLRESSELNQQLRQELSAVKLSYEALHQRQEELTASCSTPPGDTGRAMSEWLRESQEATKELLKLKDHLIEVERNNATLQAERQAMQAQLKQLESHSESQQAQMLALQRQAVSLQENNTALQTHNANLQVEKSTLTSQSASLMAQNAQLQQRRSGTESERDNAIREREELRGAHEQLLRDHERLAALHERQEMEYEALMGKHGCLKNAHRTLELEHRTLQDRHNNMLQQRGKLEELEKALKEEQMRMALEKEQHRSSAAECCRLRDEKDWLNQTYRQLLNDNELLTADHKQLKGQLNEVKLQHTWLEADFSKLKKEFQQLDISCTKLSNQCELLSQLKGNLEEENRHLLVQIDTLMLQNRTLLEQTMESKDLFHVEERQYIDKLHDLRRQKEKLEEKIMDQYRFYEPSVPRRRGNWIALKLKKLMKSSSREHEPEQAAAPPTSDVAQTQPFCPDSGSCVSSEGSGGSSSTSAGDGVSPQRADYTLKKFQHTRNKLKHRDKVKSFFRRSTSLSSLVYPSAPAEEEQERWVGSSEAEDVEDRRTTLTSSFTTSILSTLHLNHPAMLPSDHLTNATEAVQDVLERWLADKDSDDSAVPSGFEDNEELQNHGLNGIQSRAQSESSGEFSLSLENEPWSNGSSPVQHPPLRSSASFCHPPSDSSTPQRSLKQHHQQKEEVLSISSGQTGPASKQKDTMLSQDFWLTRGTKSIRRGSRGKMTRCSSDSCNAGKENPDLSCSLSSSKVESGNSRATVLSPITVLCVQGKSSSVSGCLNCFSTPLAKECRAKRPKSPKALQRASSVISTAEGSSRRASVNSNCRATVKEDETSIQCSEKERNQEEKANEQQSCGMDTDKCEQKPPEKPPRDPTVIVSSDCPKPPVQESLFDSAFSFNSVFSDTIFGNSVAMTAASLEDLSNNQTSLCLSPALEKNCPAASQDLPRTIFNIGNDQNAKHSADLQNDKSITTA